MRLQLLSHLRTMHRVVAHKTRLPPSLDCLLSLPVCLPLSQCATAAAATADGLSSNSNQHHHCNGGFRKLLARKEKRRWREREREGHGMEYKESRERGGDPNRQWPPSQRLVGVASRDKRRRSPLLSLPLLLPDIREKEEEREGKGNLCIRKGLRCPTNQHSSGLKRALLE